MPKPQRKKLNVGDSIITSLRKHGTDESIKIRGVVKDIRKRTIGLPIYLVTHGVVDDFETRIIEE